MDEKLTQHVALSTDELREFGVDHVEDIPMSSPIADGVVGWKKGKIDEIRLDGLAELDEVPLELMREWLQEILDSWPNIPKYN